MPRDLDPTRTASRHLALSAQERIRQGASIDAGGVRQLDGLRAAVDRGMSLTEFGHERWIKAQQKRGLALQYPGEPTNFMGNSKRCEDGKFEQLGPELLGTHPPRI